jgi:hypothetical protein
LYRNFVTVSGSLLFFKNPKDTHSPGIVNFQAKMSRKF